MSEADLKREEEEIQAAEKELDDAFDSGFGDGEMVVDMNDLIPGEEIDEVLDDEIIVDKNSDDEATAPGSNDEASDKDKPKSKEQTDPWAGVPPAVRAKLEEIEGLAVDATQVAKSAAGRANKLRLQEEKEEEQKEAPAPGPSADLIKKALTDQEAMNKLREDWPDHALAMEEMGTVLASVVDNNRDSLRQEIESRTQATAAEVRMMARIDNAHPDWEEVVSSDDFKNWVYEGGPSLSERSTYDQLITSGDSRTDEYYENLLAKYPDWAEDRGKLYGTNSANASISLLDMHKESLKEKGNVEQDDQDRNAELEARRRRLRRNVPATQGKGVSSPESQKDLESYLEEGFNG